MEPNNEKVKAIPGLKHPENQKQLKSVLETIQNLAKFLLPRLSELSERTDRLRQLLNKNTEWNWGEDQDRDFTTIKKLLTEESGN